jgi:hypothetical protein
MLNGGSISSSNRKLAEPMFNLLGTPADRKRRVVYDTSHTIPRTELIRESIEWMDRYLGPSDRAAGTEAAREVLNEERATSARASRRAVSACAFPARRRRRATSSISPLIRRCRGRSA